MLQTVSLLLPILPLVFSAPAPASTPNVSSLKPIAISKFNFHSSSVDFTFSDPNTKVKTTCSASGFPTSYTACKNPDVAFKFASGDKASDFHISLKETYTSGDTFFVGTASKEVTQSPKKFDVPVKKLYPFKPFELPEIFTFSPSGRPGSSPYATLNFTVTDVNSNGKATAKCTTQWTNGQQPSTGDIPCADPSFVFRVTDYKGIGQFRLGLSHTYPLKKGAATKITSSGSLTLDNSTPDRNFVCIYGASGVGGCNIAEGKAPLKAPISSVTGF